LKAKATHAGQGSYGTQAKRQSSSAESVCEVDGTAGEADNLEKPTQVRQA